jgi:hypothetical protein
MVRRDQKTIPRPHCRRFQLNDPVARPRSFQVLPPQSYSRHFQRNPQQLSDGPTKRFSLGLTVVVSNSTTPQLSDGPTKRYSLSLTVVVSNSTTHNEKTANNPENLATQKEAIRKTARKRTILRDYFS